MPRITEEEVRHIAKLARLRLSETDVGKFAVELGAILDYIAILKELDTEHVEPTAQVTGLTNVLREDTAQPSEAAEEDLLACSPLPIVRGQIETLSAHEKG